MKRNLWCSLVLALVASSGSEVAVAEIYQWVDDKGRVHYSDRKPKGVQADDVSEALAPVNSDSSAAARAPLNKTFAPPTQEEVERKKREQQKLAESRVEQQKVCTQMRNNLKTLKGRVYFVREDGSEYTVSEKERAKMVSDLEANIRRRCG